MADPLTDKLTDIADQLEKLVQAHGNDAWELAQGAARVAAANDLLSAASSVAIAIVLGLLGSKLLRMFKTSMGGSKDFIDGNPALCMGGVLISAAALVAGCIGVSGLLSATAWVGMFEPKIYLAMKLLKL